MKSSDLFRKEVLKDLPKISHEEISKLTNSQSKEYLKVAMAMAELEKKNILNVVRPKISVLDEYIDEAKELLKILFSIDNHFLFQKKKFEDKIKKEDIR